VEVERVDRLDHSSLDVLAQHVRPVLTRVVIGDVTTVI